MATVLIVDDDPDARLILDRVLRHAGHSTTLAMDGREASELWKQTRSLVALIDIFMPEMDGIDTICALRTDCPEARIIAMSAGWSGGADAAGVDVLNIAHEMGADRILRKPLDPDVVCREVDAVLRETTPGRPFRTRAVIGVFTMPVTDAERAWVSAQPTPDLSRLAEQLLVRLVTSSGAKRTQRHNRLAAVLDEIERRRCGAPHKPEAL